MWQMPSTAVTGVGSHRHPATESCPLGATVLCAAFDAATPAPVCAASLPEMGVAVATAGTGMTRSSSAAALGLTMRGAAADAHVPPPDEAVVSAGTSLKAEEICTAETQPTTRDWDTNRNVWRERNSASSVLPNSASRYRRFTCEPRQAPKGKCGR